jgi:acetyl-CoA C-acetyltransferase
MLKRRRKLGRGVALVGAGMSKFGAFDKITTRDLLVDAFNAMKASVDKGFETKDIEALYLGNGSSDIFEHQLHVGPVTGNWLGLIPKPTLKIADACAGSGVAFREAILGIASGIYDIVLAGGIEKMTNLPTVEVTEGLAFAMDGLTEFPAGFTFPGAYANMATAHMAKYGTTVEDFMRVGIKNHNNAAFNPKAHLNASIGDFMKRRVAAAVKRGLPEPHWADEMEFLHDPEQNPIIAWPMRLFDCSTICDGATLTLLVAEEIAKDFTDDPLYVIGTGQASDYPLHEREDMTSIMAAKEAARQAYEMAGVGPQDIKLAEVHDCFSIAEIIAIEDLGFFKPGEAVKAIREGVTARDGAKPINTSGGLKAKGHPIGASGTGQVVEVWEQMRGRAGPRQVTGRDIDLALTHNIGAHGATCALHILERR